MIRKYLQKIASFHADGVLAVIFLVFCVSVGLSGLPQFLANSRSALAEKDTFRQYIERIDDQYYEMLTTESSVPFLQNKATYINLNGLMAKILGQQEINTVMKLKNGYLSWQEMTDLKPGMNVVLENILRFSQKQTQQGKSFLFVLAPSKTYQHDQNFPVGFDDTANEDAEIFLKRLEENQIAYVDLRSEMESDGISYEDAFYVTDHHWTTQTGFWAYTKILDALQENGSIPEVDSFYTDPENYQFRVYEDNFLGSMGKRTGIYYAGLDDFCIITPKYDTDLSIQIPGTQIDFRGDFENVAYNFRAMDILEENDYFNDNPYGLFGWGDYGLTHWKNENAPESRNVMLIGNSYGNVPFAFLPLYFSSCAEMDMRFFTDSFEAFYESYAPDTVILLVHVDNIVSENTYYPFFP